MKIIRFFIGLAPIFQLVSKYTSRQAWRLPACILKLLFQVFQCGVYPCHAAKISDKTNLANNTTKEFSMSRSIFSLAILCYLLSACGGAPLNNPNYLEENGLGREIVVNVTGLDGVVSVEVGSSSVTFTEDGSQTVGGQNPVADISARITASPEGQSCFFSPSNLTQIVASDQVNVVCGAPGISGSIKNFFTGDVIAGAELSVTEVADDIATDFTASVSDGSGNYEIEGTTAGNRYVVTVTADGFASQSVIGLPTDARPFVIENILMVPQNGTDTADPTSPMSFDVDGVTVLQIPANGLQKPDGSAPNGNVTARLTFIEPSQGANALPGRYEFDDGNGFSFIETFGALGANLTDADGDVLTLADGISATVSIPIATRAQATAPSSASIYVFNQGAGYWESDSSASATTSGGVPVYQSSVDSISPVFTSGDTYDTVQISGTIEDSGGNGVVDATVVVQGGSYIGTSYAISDSSGEFVVQARAESSVFVYGLVGARSRTESVEDTTTSDVSLANPILFNLNSTVIELTWGQNPSDLDSHLYGPTDSGRFHIDYTNTSQTVNDVTVFLDVDDVTSFGPEVTTIPSFPAAGVYEFYVDLFSGSGSITDSPARVELNQEGENFTFSPPASGATRCWHVFNIVVDSALDAEVVSVNEYIADRAVCTDSGQEGSTPTPSLEKTSLGGQRLSPGSEAILRKYYAE